MISSALDSDAHPPSRASTSDINRVVFASSVGTIIEWYDFLIYGTAAALVFGKLFFPDRKSVV